LKKKLKSFLEGNLNSGFSYLITTVLIMHKNYEIIAGIFFSQLMHQN